MSRFLEHYTAWITPLSPIHIGTGEDYEPTNSVVVEKDLVHFDPLGLNLPRDQRDRLIGILDGLDRYGAAPTLLKIRGFFSSQFSRAQDAASIRIPLPRGVAEHIRATNRPVPKVPSSKAKKEEQDVVNQLAIPRTIRQPHTGALFLPGTSLKGAWRTAWLEKRVKDLEAQIPNKHKHQRFEWELLDGSFARDPFRLVKTSDATGDPAGAILLVLDVARARPRKNDPAVMTMVEAVLPGQFRTWQTAVALFRTPAGTRRLAGKLPFRQLSLRKLVNSVNTFSLRRWDAERRELQHNTFLARDWMIAVDGLLKREMLDRLRSGQALLMRVGHYSGEEFVRYGNEVRHETDKPIPPRKKMKGRETTPCIRLAGRSKTDHEALPFGWVLVELAPAGEEPPPNPALEKFCARWREWAGGGPSSAPAGDDRHARVPAPEEVQSPHELAVRHGAQKEQERLSQPQDEGAIDITIPDKNNGNKIRIFLSQLRKSPGDLKAHQDYLQTLVRQAASWTPEEKAALVEVVDRLVRPRLGNRADHFKWKQLLDRIDRLRPQR